MTKYRTHINTVLTAHSVHSREISKSHTLFVIGLLETCIIVANVKPSNISDWLLEWIKE
jgi:hypothetical protein